MFSKALPFLLLPYLTRKLGVDGYGELAYYQSLIAFIIIFLGISQHGAIARYYYRYGQRALNLVVTCGYIYSIAIFIIGTLASIILKSEILFYCFLVALFQSLHSVQLYLRQCSKDALGFVKLQVLTSLLNTFATVALLEVFSDALVKKRIIAIILAYSMVFLYAYCKSSTIISFKYKFSFRQYKLASLYILAFGIPLVFHSLSYTIKGQLDRVLIFKSYSTTELGVYAAGVQIASMLSVLIMSINIAVVPYLYQAFKDKIITKDDIIKLYYWSFLIVPVPYILSLLIPESLIALLLGIDFTGSSYYFHFFIFCYSLIIPYLILVSYLFYEGKTKEIALCSIVSVTAYVYLLFQFSEYSIRYMPFATLISNVITLPFLHIFIRRIKNNEVLDV